MSGGGEFEVVVRRREAAADSIVLLDLVSPTGAPLPGWSPGAHIDVVLPDGRERQYSLCSDPNDRMWWRIGVLRERDVSAYLHDVVREGDRLLVRGPRNHFAFAPFPGRKYLFVAGGIGITPIYAMLRSAAAAGNETRLVYAGRSRAAMAFAEELTAEYADSAEFYASDEGSRADIAALLADPAPGTIVYCCGPRRLIEAVEAAGASWPRGSIHLERFEAKVLGEPIWNEPFDVELLLSGMTVTVQPEETILDVVERNGLVVPSSCRVGTCGTCEVAVVDGEIEHRDSVLSPRSRRTASP
ncbi:PDR/VanB family oxidoreductase [Naasia aerilata]|uniref:PDR/VanB family oxidoreductase n=1 Tax=Naasia aerilata TaxID=1162966 RepID=UPI002573ADE7|nr:PDR/VanB family oxidoreductase [Naasia aerilata]